jgi:hypothetical protein
MLVSCQIKCDTWKLVLAKEKKYVLAARLYFPVVRKIAGVMIFRK